MLIDQNIQNVHSNLAPNKALRNELTFWFVYLLAEKRTKHRDKKKSPCIHKQAVGSSKCILVYKLIT